MNLRNLFLSVILLTVSMLVIEFGLRLLTPFPIHAHSANRVEDPYLIYRLSPSLQDADGSGFRNSAVPDEVNIVALGDSHTFGFNVRSEDSWPQQLARMSNMTVYNFGLGGYGSLHYYYLINEAIKLKPRHLILALYLHNDLNDVCKTMRKLPYWQSWAEEKGFDVEACYEGGDPRSNDRQTEEGLSRSLRENTAIASLFSYVWGMVAQRFTAAGEFIVVDDENNPTLISTGVVDAEGLSGIRFMDLDRKQIALGYEITKYALEEAKKKCDANNIEFSVVFIPSKVMAYFNYLQGRPNQLHDSYYELVAKERILLDRFSSILDDLSVNHVDAGPYVLRKMNKASAVYMRSSDDHPLVPGYSAYAEAVYDKLLARD